MSSNNTTFWDVLIAYKWPLVSLFFLLIAGISFGFIPVPDFGLSDLQKVMILGTLGAWIIVFFPAYIKAQEEVEVDYEFVQVLNAETDETRVWAAPPEKVEEIDFEKGGFDDLRATGARWNIVREFDPQEMVAVGNDTSMATDRELRDDRNELKNLRKYMTEKVKEGERLRALAPVMKVLSDNEAVNKVDRNMRQALSDGSLDFLLMSESEYEQTREEVQKKDNMTKEEMKEQIKEEFSDNGTDSETTGENGGNGGDEA
ncbi:hypothetical protein HTZ84_04910 [Haloterrigena sp. SYSU A558-1]|uniref:Uncharacterized protein n=1 Tax=Haloterrigena gelatinilytica TaxID=2741724 RepID=A0ABX2LG07_9EURY|nr:hypothetical protein [Haloterrigena gelatinilytica]NUC71656.1 hypothetical protein [Haloterrigena gelatinilytica]